MVGTAEPSLEGTDEGGRIPAKRRKQKQVVNKEEQQKTAAERGIQTQEILKENDQYDAE